MLFFDFTSKSRTYFHRHHFPCILRKLSWENIFRNMDKILFHSTTSFNFSFLLVIAQFSSSLSNFLLLARVFSPSPLSSFPFYRTILLLSLSSRHILSAFLVFAASAGRLSIGYLDRTNARPEWDSSLSLFLAPRGFLDSAHPAGVSCLLSNEEPPANEAEDAVWIPCALALIDR